ncbi:hypothetical protein Pmar_PMAR027468, partial [Perkinsus marinus ATCC 50983]
VVVVRDRPVRRLGSVVSGRRRLERLSWPMLVVIGKGILGDLMISNDWYVGIVVIKIKCI